MIDMIARVVALTISVFISGAIGMWFTGAIFPELSYFNYVGIAVFLTWVVAAGSELQALGREQ